jgi:hypothetical protein
MYTQIYQKDLLHWKAREEFSLEVVISHSNMSKDIAKSQRTKNKEPSLASLEFLVEGLGFRV